MQHFLGDASHELRTPLTVIKGYVELAIKSENQSDSKKFLTKSTSEIQRMEGLISDILLLAEIGELPQTPEEKINFSQLVTNLLDGFRATSPERLVESTVAPDISFIGDEYILTQMVSNIFANIRRHTPVDAPVRVNLSRSSNSISLVIEDGGPGMAILNEPGLNGGSLRTRKLNREGRVFHRFDKSRSRESGGSGLGISIIEGAVKRYSGSVELKRSDLGGLAVGITLPL